VSDYVPSSGAQINATVAVAVDIRVDQGWHREHSYLVRGETGEQDRVLCDRDAIVEYIRDVLTGQETGDPPWRASGVYPLHRAPEPRAVDVGVLAEAIHTAFRKATDDAAAMKIHRLIQHMPPQAWGAIVEFVHSTACSSITSATADSDLIVPPTDEEREAMTHLVVRHELRLAEAQKMDADPRTFARAICSCGDYTSSVDSPAGATRAWLAHWQARTRGVGR
jgi:hypothetical protein